MSENYGDNKVSSIELNSKGSYIFADNVYKYFYSSLTDTDEIIVNDLKSFTIHVMTTSGIALLNDQIIKPGQTIQVENENARITVQEGNVKILIAGVKEQIYPYKSVKIIEADEIKKVVKPWGYELWLTGEHPGYAFKNIFIKATTKTSLQFHQMKQETNVLFKGETYLHFKKTKAILNNDVKSSDIERVQLYPISSIDILPNTIHRLEAITDIELYEVSTPHLDDVIRISDDNRRPDGRIETEHIRKT